MKHQQLKGVMCALFITSSVLAYEVDAKATDIMQGG